MRKSKIDLPDEQQRFESFLRSRQLKLTGERRELLAEVFAQTEHFDADQLHIALKQKGPSAAPRSTARWISWSSAGWSARAVSATSTRTTSLCAATSTMTTSSA